MVIKLVPCHYSGYSPKVSKKRVGLACYYADMSTDVLGMTHPTNPNPSDWLTLIFYPNPNQSHSCLNLTNPTNDGWPVCLCLQVVMQVKDYLMFIVKIKLQ